MYAVPMALEQYLGTEFRGHVIYPDGNVQIPSLSGLDQKFTERLGGLIRRLADRRPRPGEYPAPGSAVSAISRRRTVLIESTARSGKRELLATSNQRRAERQLRPTRGRDAHSRVEAMLAGWPLLYPETTDAVEQDDHGHDHAAKVRRQVIAPILESQDLLHTFEEKREEYSKWLRLPGVGLNWDQGTLLAQEDRKDRKDDALIATFNDHRELLGDANIKATLESVRLRKIVRRSTIPYRETWPEESWEKIAHLMTSSELCNAGILEHLATRAGRNERRIETLARWGFQYALDAYWDAGHSTGSSSTKLEDIPE